MEKSAVNTPVSAILVDPQKWRVLLDQFEEVLKLNICIVDPQGNLAIPHRRDLASGEGGRFGVDVLKSTFRIDFVSREGGDFWANFEPRGLYLEVEDPFEQRLFAVPISKGMSSGGEAAKPWFYLLIGPLRLSKAWPDEKYLALIESLGLDREQVLGQIREVPLMSEAALSAILELLSEVVKDVFEVTLENQKILEMQSHPGDVRPELYNEVKGLLMDIQQDELLISILDAAIKMAGAEGGSIMIFDEMKKDFVIKVSRGLEHKDNILQERFKMGEGIAGIAARERVPFFISGTEGDERIKHLLKRPEIKHSFVVPILAADQRAIGVLNLSIKNRSKVIPLESIQKDIQQFSPLIATALASF